MGTSTRTDETKLAKHNRREWRKEKEIGSVYIYLVVVSTTKTLYNEAAACLEHLPIFLLEIGISGNKVWSIWYQLSVMEDLVLINHVGVPNLQMILHYEAELQRQ